MGYFDKIVQHLERKKPVKTHIRTDGKPGESSWEVTRPVVRISEDGLSLYCCYAHHYLFIRYNKDKAFNPYHISIESQVTFAWFQMEGTRCYEEDVPTQDDVLACIRYRLRSDR